jgi:soluble lytic murein transglycosylase-like protein
LCLSYAMAPTSHKMAQEALKVERREIVAPAVSRGDIQHLVRRYAFVYDVPEEELFYVLNCESSMNPKAVGDSGHSRGLSQIHDVYHPEVSQEQAFSPDYAIRFLAKAISEGKGGQWTCWRKYKGL